MYFSPWFDDYAESWFCIVKHQNLLIYEDGKWTSTVNQPVLIVELLRLAKENKKLNDDIDAYIERVDELTRALYYED